MTLTERLLLEKLYAAECALPERNFAKGHSFEEWLRHEGYEQEDCSASQGSLVTG